MKKDILFFDEQTFDRSMHALNTLLLDSKLLCETWHSIRFNTKLLPELTSELFLSWIKNPELMEELFNKAADKTINSTLWPGASEMMKGRFYDLKQVFDYDLMIANIDSLNMDPLSPSLIFFNRAWISFKDDKPYISDETIELIRDKCSLTAEQNAWIDQAKKLAETAQEHGLEVVNSNLIQVDKDGNITPNLFVILQKVRQSDPDAIDNTGTSARPPSSLPTESTGPAKRARIPQAWK